MTFWRAHRWTTWRTHWRWSLTIHRYDDGRRNGNFILCAGPFIISKP